MGGKKFSINKFSKATLFAVVAWAILSASIGLVNAVPGEEPLPQLWSEELVSRIAMCEKKLSNLKVKSELWVERREPNSQKWQPTPVYASCTAWFDGEPNGRARIDMHKEILEWKDGAAPFSESSYSTAFDGRYGRTVYYRMGPIGQAHKIRKGIIYPEAPGILRDKWLGGTAFSMFFLFDQIGCPRGERLSDYLTEVLSQFGPFPITWDTLEDTNCIRIGGGDPEGGHEFLWLDPARGFALLRYEIVNITRDGRKWLSESQTVTKLTEAAPGLWYPIEAYAESTTSPGLERTNRRVRYLASEVVANEPNFDESIFTLTFPAGCFIHDKVKDVGYRAGSPLDKLREMLDQLVDETFAASDPADGNNPKD